MKKLYDFELAAYAAKGISPIGLYAVLGWDFAGLSRESAAKATIKGKTLDVYYRLFGGEIGYSYPVAIDFESGKYYTGYVNGAATAQTPFDYFEWTERQIEKNPPQIIKTNPQEDSGWWGEDGFR